MGCGGGGGGGGSSNNNNNDGGDNRPYYIVSFETDGGSEVEEQLVVKGGTASQPHDPVKENNDFIGWYYFKDESDNFAFIFNFDMSISQDITLYAKWYNSSDIKDSDGDGLSDSLEETFSTDPFKIDTDNDGLADLVKAVVQVPRGAAEGKYKAASIYDPTPYGAGTVDEAIAGDDGHNLFVEKPFDYDTLYRSCEKREPAGEMTTLEAAKK